MSAVKETFPWKWTRISKVNIEGDKIKADINAFVEYYFPFNYYEEDHSKNKKKSKSLFEDFASIKINETHSIAKFIQKYGFLTLSPERGQVYYNLKTKSYKPHSESLTDFKEEYMHFKQISDLYASYNEDTPEKLLLNIKELDTKPFCTSSKIAREIILENSTDSLWMQNELKHYSMNIIAYEIIKKTKPITNRLVVNNDLTFDRVWYAPDLLSMIYQMFSLKITSGKILRKCHNTYCDSSFFLYKNDRRKIYCSPECASQQTSSRYRERHKDEINAKKRAARKSNK